MKKLLPSITFCVLTFFANAQNTFPTSGNVGIGTSTPDQRLTINGGGIGFDWNSSDKKLYSPADGDLEWMTHNAAAVHGFAISHQGNKIVYFNIAGNSYINGGNLGIGTINPGVSLDVYGNSTIGDGNSDAYFRLRGYNGSVTEFYNNTGASPNYNGFSITTNPSQANSLPSWRIDIGGANNPAFHNGDSFSVTRQANEFFRISSAGNVGIGTAAPDQKLSVAGTIHSQAVKVDMTGWSDYVFNPEYNLSTLEQIKAFVDKNHHLPDMPSEKEVVNNGIDLGQMINLQQKKIEELTLYLIAKDKKDQAIAQELTALKKQVKYLQHERRK